MELSFSSFLIFSLLILNALNIRGDFNYYVNKENWIDPDPLGRIFKEIDSRTTMEKEARYVTSVVLSVMSFLSLELELALLFIYILMSKVSFFHSSPLV
jgi:hypothetical protein